MVSTYARGEGEWSKLPFHILHIVTIVFCRIETKTITLTWKILLLLSFIPYFPVKSCAHFRFSIFEFVSDYEFTGWLQQYDFGSGCELFLELNHKILTNCLSYPKVFNTKIVIDHRISYLPRDLSRFYDNIYEPRMRNCQLIR